MPIKTSILAELVDGKIVGDESREISRVASPESAGPEEIAFIADPDRYSGTVSESVGCLLVPTGRESAFGCTTISVGDPKAAFARIGSALHPRKDRPGEIHPSAVIDVTATIGDQVFIGAGCVVEKGSFVGSGTHLLSGTRIGEDVVVGADCTIHQNVVVGDGCEIGSRVTIKAGAVIGSHGFGFVRDGAELVRFPQVGTVVIEDDVEIGANTCVDRGALGETRIGAGTKIDNLVQVAHNVKIGKRVVIASQTGISGSVTIEDDCVVGGQVGFADHTHIEKGAVIGAKSAVFPGKRLKSGVWGGIPVLPLAEYKRLNALFRSLPKLRSDVRSLTEAVSRLERILESGDRGDR